MLMERRTMADLEEVLAERLAVIRSQREPAADPAPRQSSRQRKSA
jgi:hypothetical protein